VKEEYVGTGEGANLFMKRASDLIMGTFPVKARAQGFTGSSEDQKGCKNDEQEFGI